MINKYVTQLMTSLNNEFIIFTRITVFNIIYNLIYSPNFENCVFHYNCESLDRKMFVTAYFQKFLNESRWNFNTKVERPGRYKPTYHVFSNFSSARSGGQKLIFTKNISLQEMYKPTKGKRKRHRHSVVNSIMRRFP